MKNTTNIPAELSLFTFPDVFSDVFNGLLFKGKEAIIPDDLVPVDEDFLHGFENEPAVCKAIISKFWLKANLQLSLFCLIPQVGQEDIPLYLFCHDSAVYHAQVVQHDAARLAAGYDTEEHPSYPVVSIALNLGIEPWPKPNTLYGCLEAGIPEELRPFANDYKVDIFDISCLEESVINTFHSDFRSVAECLVQARKKGSDYSPEDSIKHRQEFLLLMKALFGEDTSFRCENNCSHPMCNK